MKIIVTVIVGLALVLAGIVGFIVVDSGKSGGALSGLEGLEGSAALGPKIATISHGERVDFSEYTAPGILTVFDFSADW